jgi:effector-binding domain-containing protein
MRALKTILIILLAVAAIVVILGYVVGSPSTVVQRSAQVEAPPDLIFPHVASLRKMHTWSPWKDMEKGQVNRWEGEDGAVGSIQYWEGDTVGKGSQRITALEQGRYVETELKFLEPWEATSQVRLDLEPEGAGTKVTWTMTQENGFMGRVMSVFLDLDRMIGGDFEKGLARLKELAEAEQAVLQAEMDARTFGGYLIDTKERPTTVFVGKRAKIGWDAMDDFMATSFPAIAKDLQAAGLSTDGPPTGVYFLWDEKNKSTDLMVAYPVKGDADLKVEGYTTHVVPACKVLHTVHLGSPELSEAAHVAMDEMIRANGLVHYGNVFEEYVVGMMNEPDMAKWVTHVQYMIQ